MSAFKEYVTSTAFSISLSRAMCEAMDFLMVDRLLRGTWHPIAGVPNLSTMASLSRRGLCLHRDGARWEMTDAGVALYPLLVLAGLARSHEEIVEAVRRAVA